LPRLSLAELLGAAAATGARPGRAHLARSGAKSRARYPPNKACDLP
jgi:hypothetical protein